MLVEDRKSQVVPTLSAAQVQFALRFASGPARRFEHDETLLDVGDRNASVWLIVEGSVIAVRRDGLGREHIFATGGPGQFTGEVSDLSGQASLVVVRGGPQGCTAYPFDPLHLRALLVGSADIGEVMMRAFILRRAAFLEDGHVGSVLLGDASSSHTMRLQGLMTRNGYPHSLVDAGGTDGRSLVDQLGVGPGDLPILVCPNGTILRRPTDSEAGIGLGITPSLQPDSEFDVVIVGAGPAGLATAVYGASEGLSVLVLDTRSLAAKRARLRESKTILDSPPAFPDRRLRRARSSRHRNLGRFSQFRFLS